MFWRHGEIYFNSRKEALSRRPWIDGFVEEVFDGFTLYQCDRCGIHFASTDASTETGAIICAVCDRKVVR